MCTMYVNREIIYLKFCFIDEKKCVLKNNLSYNIQQINVVVLVTHTFCNSQFFLYIDKMGKAGLEYNTILNIQSEFLYFIKILLVCLSIKLSNTQMDKTCQTW